MSASRVAGARSAGTPGGRLKQALRPGRHDSGLPLARPDRADKKKRDAYSCVSANGRTVTKAWVLRG